MEPPAPASTPPLAGFARIIRGWLVWSSVSDLNHQRDIWVLFGNDVVLAVITVFDWQA